MSGDSTRQLSQRLAERMAEDKGRIEALTSSALEQHAKNLSNASRRALDGIERDLASLNQSATRVWKKHQQTLAKSFVLVGVIWGLAIAGLLLNGTTWWWESRQIEQIQRLQEVKNEIESFQGATLIIHQNKTYLVAPRLGKVFQTSDGRTAVELNPRR